MIKSNKITGLFLEFDNDELDNIDDALKNKGYEPGIKGLKSFIVDKLFELEPDERMSEQEYREQYKKAGYGEGILDYIRENPEKVQQAAQTVSMLARGLFSKVKK